MEGGDDDAGDNGNAKHEHQEQKVEAEDKNNSDQENEQQLEEEEEEEEEAEDHDPEHGPDGNDNDDDSHGPTDDMMTITTAEQQPSYKKANKLKFAPLCQRMETLSRFSREKAKRNVTKDEKLNHLLPPALLDKLKHGNSAFPLLRLLIPDRDSTLKVRTGESTLGQAYCQVLGHERHSKYWKILSNCTDPRVCGEEFAETVGDFCRTLEKVVARSTRNQPSNATVGDINKILDGLTKDLSGKSNSNNSKRHSTHDWRAAADSQSQMSQSKTTASKKKKKAPNKRVKWVKRAMNDLKLSPLEHKWLAKIITGDRMHLGIGWEAILTWYSPHAMDVWSSHNNLKTVCNKLCNDAYIQQRQQELQEAKQRQKAQRFTQLYNFPVNPDPVLLGNTISAMRSERTSFESLMYDMRKKHAEVLKKKIPKDDHTLQESLALKFPAFAAEVKLDGERMIVHMNHHQGGQVTMHTRQGRWYSPPYSPIVGPALRKSILAKNTVSVILDGEILAWDDGRKEHVPFGSNRTVAILRQKWLASQGLLQDIDLGLHEGEDEKYVMRYKDVQAFEKDANNEPLEGGAECWLKFVAFDVLYVGGPDAAKVIAESLPSEQEPKTTPGSIIHLSGFERRRILYRLIEPQENQVEIVQNVVIRPNGECARGCDYFSPTDPLMDCGLPAYILDSAKWTLNEGHPSLKDFDEQRRNGRSDMVISARRTHYANQFYHSIVDQQKLEGIVVKDLAAPYILRSRTRLWLKIKPDYSNDSFASDIDVVVIGGSFATGCRRAGEISSFLCACVDSEDPKKFFTFCRLNAKSLKDGKLDEIMKRTEFCKATPESPVSYGKWFREQQHGETVPDFISMRSFQVGQEDRQGWRFDRIKNYPDLFIHPDDSVVLTVNSSEIVRSDEYSAGLTLRFPRATRLRIDADAKPPSEIESEEDLYRMYDEYKHEMRKYATTSTAGFDPISPSKHANANSKEDKIINQFLTAEQYTRNQKNRIKERKNIGNVQHLDVPEKKKSNALAGLKFCVLEGAYHFNESGLDSEDAKEEGWYEEARNVRKAMDVRSFIAMHGGSVVRTPGRDVYVIGGNKVDARVKYNIQGYEALRDKEAQRKTKNDSNNAPENLDLPGVLKWTFVFSLVHRWLNKKNALPMDDSDDDSSDEDDSEDEAECIKETVPELLSPRFFDYLAQSEVYGDDPFESIWKVGDLDEVGMKRALSFLQDSSDSRTTKRAKVSPAVEVVQWQRTANESLSEEDRWVVSCHYQTLWPFSREENGSSESREAVIIYPDLFGEDFGAASEQDAIIDDARGSQSQRWKEMPRSNAGSSVASALPLLRCMGATVTAHLHEGVTHILCNLKDCLESIWWPSGDRTDVFRDKEIGRRLLERLNAVKEGGDTSGQVLLVSRKWVDSKWNY